MGLFNRRTPAEAVRVAAPAQSHPGSLTLSSGRRLGASVSGPDMMSVISEIMDAQRPRSYATLPHFVQAGSRWLGDQSVHPNAVACGIEVPGDGSPIFISFRTTTSGCEVGLFPLGAGDDRLNLPLVGLIKQRVPSLSSLGLFPSGTLAITSPAIRPDTFQSTLTAAGRQNSASNEALIAEVFTNMVKTKVLQFAEALSGPHTASEIARGVNSSQDAEASIAGAQKILHAGAEQCPAMIPYIQDLPLRVRAVMLASMNDLGSFWARID